MKNTSAFKRYMVAAAVSMVALLTTSMTQAATVVCPDILPDNNNPRQYQTTSAIDCVWGNGNIGQGQPANDAFLLGNGTNDTLYGTTATLGPKFGLTWTTIDSQDAGTGGIQGSLSGLMVSGSDNNTFTWTLDTTYLASLSFANNTYALGLVDGGDPKWAVFLLSGLTGTADIISREGSWSHVVLYGTYVKPGSPPPAEIPEPGTLALVGLALLGGAAIRRRKV